MKFVFSFNLNSGVLNIDDFKKLDYTMLQKNRDFSNTDVFMKFLPNIDQFYGSYKNGNYKTQIFIEVKYTIKKLSSLLLFFLI